MAFEHIDHVSHNCMLSYYELIITAIESKCSADVIYLDFAKAFHKVDHRILLKKKPSLVDSQFSLRQKATSCCRRNSVG